jgi:hypothetical protein
MTIDTFKEGTLPPNTFEILQLATGQTTLSHCWGLVMEKGSFEGVKNVKGNLVLDT